MKCEKCGQEHDGSYGSGRFCSAHCARSFSTSAKREEINTKVSKTLRKNFKEQHGLTKKEKKCQCIKAKKSMKAEYIQKLLNSGNYRYAQYEDIDLGTNYLVGINGEIISCVTLKELATTFTHDSYRRVVVMDTSKNKHLVYAHRIVACTYIPNPNNYPIINHKDENPKNTQFLI